MLTRRCLTYLVYAYLVLTAGARAAELRISGLEDFILGEVTPSNAKITQRLQACVSMTPAGPFQLTAIGDGWDGRYSLSDPNSDLYQISFDVSAGQRVGARKVALSPGVPSGPFFAREPHRNGNCRPPRLSLLIEIDARELGRVPPGRYSGQLQLIVSPE